MKQLWIFCCSFLLFQCQTPHDTYHIPFSGTDVTATISPILQWQGNNLIVSKWGAIEKHNIEKQSLEWSYILQHPLRACLVSSNTILAISSYQEDNKLFSISHMITSQKGHLLQKDTILGQVEFLWAIPNTEDYLIQTTVYEGNTISSFLEKRNIGTGVILWRINKTMMSPPSTYNSPYAYMVQLNKIHVLDVNKGLFLENCLEYLDTTIRFYQQQVPTSAKRELNWYQLQEGTCQLQQKGWAYKVELETGVTLLGTKGATQLYKLSPRTTEPVKGENLKAPLQNLLPTENGYLYYLEEEKNNIYHYKETTGDKVVLPLTGNIFEKKLWGISLTYHYPYIAYFQQENSAYKIVCQNIAKAN
ncbi:MAG: hypothetical protein AB8E82_18255 [Aureispira sp.]